MKISRRNFLKASAGAVAAAHFAKGTLALRALEEGKGTPLTTKKFYTTCDVCAMYCAMEACVEDGTLVKLEGDSRDQQSGGSLCAKGNAGINWLYSPDRLKYPLKRTNPEKGIDADPGWIEISWDEAFDEVADKLTEIKNKYGAKAIIGFGHEVYPLLKALGTPNLLCHHGICQFGVSFAYLPLLGSPVFPDFENSRYILTFGWNQLGNAKNAYARNFAEAKANGAKVVVFEPRLSPTAAKADEWIPIKPGTDLAVALAMINVIVTEGLYDADYVANYTHGFDKLVEFIKEYPPGWAAQISDVPSDTIRRIARDFATTKPAVIPHFKGPGASKINSSRLTHAIVILQALTGNIETRGGSVFCRHMKLGGVASKLSPPEPETEERIDGKDKLPGKGALIGGHGILYTVAESMLKEEPYPVKAAVVCRENVVVGYPNTSKMVDAFKKLDFVVNISVWPDETVWLADIVLPSLTYLERSQIVPRTKYPVYPQISCRQPVVDTLWNTKEEEEMFHEIAKRMGIEDYLSPHGIETLNKKLEPLEIDFEYLKSKGVINSAELPGGSREDIEFKPKQAFATSTRKIELYSTKLEELGYDPLPTWKELKEPMITTEGYPFYVLFIRLPFSRHARNQNLRWIHELYPENFAYMNADKANELGIKDEDEVYVESESDRIKIKAKLIQGTRPDTVAIPHGWGHFSKDLTLVYGKGGDDNMLPPTMTIQEMLDMKEPYIPSKGVIAKVYKA